MIAMEVTLYQMEAQQDAAQQDHDSPQAFTARMERYLQLQRQGVDLPENIVMLIAEFTSTGRAS